MSHAPATVLIEKFKPMSESNNKQPDSQKENGSRQTEEPNAADHTVLLNHDKTRLSQPREPLQVPAESEHNRANQNAAPNPDVTRFQPPEKLNADRTRLAPSRPPASQTAGKVDNTEQLIPQNVPAGDVLKGRFLLEKVLGVGGMGVVYKAKDSLKIEAQDKDPYVAIKVLSDEFKSHPEAFIALQRESRKTQRLSHPNIVKVFDFDKDGELFFMTMEYMEGKPLDQLIRQYSATGLPWDDVWGYVRDMCSALTYAHAENIVHADFKPGNIFATTTGVAKIFDFGIARAVTNIDRTDGQSIDKTVFDAGNLGALTPAYASYEMLKGEEPDVRDDIYALGCITYELFTGKHPFNKLPADEAKDKRLKPKRINGLTKRQWRAIEKALVFEREQRIASVDEFYKQLTVKNKPRYLLIAGVFVLAGVAGFSFMQEEEVIVAPAPSVSEHDIRNEMEFNIRLGLFKEAINSLLNNPTFTAAWEENIWKEYQGLREFLPNDDNWLAEVKTDTFTLYFNKIQSEREAERFDVAQSLIKNASRYSDDLALLSEENKKLTEAMNKKAAQQRQIARQQKQQSAAKQKREQEAQRIVDEYNLALSNVNQQLTCRDSLNMRKFDIAIRQLQTLDPKQYAKIENEIISSLASCIQTQAKQFPERAIEAKKYAQRLFENDPLIAAIHIIPRDACDESIAGLGGRGQRATCKDTIPRVGDGPALVVVPSGRNIKSFAIGKYEVTIAEFNQFCLDSKRCEAIKDKDSAIPVTTYSVDSVKAYIKWLSQRTGKKYRLPTQDEWTYAANATTTSHDPNRNCQFSSRGIQKGDGLVKATTGKQNPWGLVNYLGNAQEWGYDKRGQLVAMGGAYSHPMDECQTSTWKSHSGQADKITGFRLLRELATDKQG